jgi:predicted transcriptional regulator
MAKTTIRLHGSLPREVRHYAADHEKTDTNVFVEALREYLEMSEGLLDA